MGANLRQRNDFLRSAFWRKANKSIQKQEDTKIFRKLIKMATPIIQTVTLKRDAKDTITGTTIKRGTKALRIETWKGCSSQITFYSLDSARRLKTQFDECMQVLDS